MTVLILGGTQEARELKAALGDRAILSLARDGGFGGPEGLARYVAEHEIEAIVDATHPFATRISANATHAGVPLMRLERPPFDVEATRIDHLGEAELPDDARVFLTTGHAGDRGTGRAPRVLPGARAEPAAHPAAAARAHSRERPVHARRTSST